MKAKFVCDEINIIINFKLFENLLKKILMKINLKKVK